MVRKILIISMNSKRYFKVGASLHYDYTEKVNRHRRTVCSTAERTFAANPTISVYSFLLSCSCYLFPAITFPLFLQNHYHCVKDHIESSHNSTYNGSFAGIFTSLHIGILNTAVHLID